MKIMIIFLLVINLSFGDAIGTKEHIMKSNKVNNILSFYGYDMDSKAPKGWLRIFNSKSKLDEYEIFVSDKDRVDIIAYFREDYEKFEKKYRRGVK